MSEERDLEQELKEEKDRYEQQNQEAYDEQTKANEELRRIQEERKKRAEIRTKKKQRINRRKQIEAANKRREEFEQEEREFYRKQDPNAKVFNRDGQEVAEDGSIIVDDSPVTGPVIEPKEGDIDTDTFGNPVYGFKGSLGGSIAFEVGANTLLDLFSPVLPLQSGGSYVINLISQIIRDPSKIGSLNQLEAGAAATSSLIPGANQYAAFLKGIPKATRGTQLARQIGRGAVDANINLAGQRIGEGEELTGEDIVTATALGGTLGGLIGSAPDIFKGGGDLPKVFRNIRKRLDGGPELVTPEGINLGQATPEFEPTTAFAIKGRGSLPKGGDLSDFLANQRNRYDVADESLRKANIDPKSKEYARIRRAARQVPEFVRRNDDGFLYFDYRLFRDSMRPKQYGRAYIELFETDLDVLMSGGAGTAGTKAFKDFNIAEFRETFKPAAELLGLTGKYTPGRMDVSNVHHIAALKGIMGIYDGLGFNSPMYKRVNAVMKESLDGLGSEQENFIRLVGGTADVDSPHYLAHLFLSDAIGPSGEKFFTDDVLINMSQSDAFRESKARELGRIIADSAKVAEQAQDAYKRLADAALATEYDDVQRTMERLLASGKLGYIKTNNVNYKPFVREKLKSGSYTPRTFDKLIQDISLIHKAIPTGSPKLIDEILFSPQLLKAQNSFQRLVTKIEEKFGEQGITGAQMRKILDSFDVRMQNAGVGQTGLFEEIPDNLMEDTLNTLDAKIKAKKLRAQQKATKKNQELYQQDKDLN